MNVQLNPEYDGCRVVDIRRGRGARARIVYARLVDKNGNLLISSTLDYIVSALKQPVQPESIEAKMPDATTSSEIVMLRAEVARLKAELESSHKRLEWERTSWYESTHGLYRAQ